MIDLEAWELPIAGKKAVIVSDSEWGLEEMEGLLTTLGGKASEKILLPHKKIDPGTYIGKGKLEEIAEIMKNANIEILLADFDLSPSQIKNIEGIIQETVGPIDPKENNRKLILDRSGIILEIFSRHARTKEAKLQVDIARLQYFMPRIAHLWSHFERQKGSGGGALKGKGMGEKQIEVDRRLVKDRVHALKMKLKEADSSRHLHRKHREDLLKVALVGYTNAGKSTLLNALTHSDVLVEDALFATLDASIRLLNPKSRPAVLAIDTVGFIDRLPHALVASFRSTLSAVLEANLLVHVIDASHPEMKRHFDVTSAVLEELGAKGYSLMVVFNKIDLCKDQAMLKVWGASLVRELKIDPPIYVSALDRVSVDNLRERILKFFEKFMETYEVIIPFEDGKTVAKIFEVGRVEVKRVTEHGTFFKLKTTPELAKQLQLEKFKI